MVVRCSVRNNKTKSIYLVAYKCNYISGQVILSTEHSGYLWVNKKSYKGLYDDSVWFKIVDTYFKNNSFS